MRYTLHKKAQDLYVIIKILDFFVYMFYPGIAYETAINSQIKIVQRMISDERVYQ